MYEADEKISSQMFQKKLGGDVLLFLNLHFLKQVTIKLGIVID